MALGLATKRLMKGFTVPPKVGLVTGLLSVHLQHCHYVLTKGKVSQRRMDPVFTHLTPPHRDPHLRIQQCRPLGSNRPCPDLQTTPPNLNSCLNEAPSYKYIKRPEPSSREIMGKLLKIAQPLNARGRPRKAWHLCVDCLQYRPMRWGYWKKKTNRKEN